MVGRIRKRVQEGIACHATPGSNISSCGWIICGDEQRLSWREIIHGKHEFHDELTTADFA